MLPLVIRPVRLDRCARVDLEEIALSEQMDVVVKCRDEAGQPLPGQVRLYDPIVPSLAVVAELKEGVAFVPSVPVDRETVIEASCYHELHGQVEAASMTVGRSAVEMVVDGTGMLVIQFSTPVIDPWMEVAATGVSLSRRGKLDELRAFISASGGFVDVTCGWGAGVSRDFRVRVVRGRPTVLDVQVN
jgi:hypothetical protein